MNAPIAALIAAEHLPPAYAETVAAVWAPLAAHLAAYHTAARRPLLIGVSGSQGSGKTTACRFLEHLLAADHGLTVATLSIDDLYLTRTERTAMARRVHPLFATRGPPGTHDIGLGHAVITALLTGAGPTAIPRFDKAIDDRCNPATWPQIIAPLDILLFEGWCIGATPQPEADLAAPMNALESREDPQMIWRRRANTALATDYAALFARIDLRIALQVPGFGVVQRWRGQQEDKLRARHGPSAGMAPAALDRFIQHYERVTRHMLADGARTADIVIPIDAQHKAGAILFQDRAGS